MRCAERSRDFRVRWRFWGSLVVNVYAKALDLEVIEFFDRMDFFAFSLEDNFPLGRVLVVIRGKGDCFGRVIRGIRRVLFCGGVICVSLR